MSKFTPKFYKKKNMKKIFTIWLLIIINVFKTYSQVNPTNYCGGVIPAPTGTTWEEIFKFKINGTSLNQSSTCATLAPGPGSILNRYSNYTGTIHQLLLPGATYTIEYTLGECTSDDNENIAVFIDYNNNNVFDLPTERVYSASNQAATLAGSTYTGTFTVPSTGIALGSVVLLRVVGIFGTGVAFTTGCGTTHAFGETEDYAIRLGEKVFDLSIDPIIEPDTVSFCGDTKKAMTVKVNNVGNQPMLGGFVKMNVLRNGILIDSIRKNLTNTILEGTSTTINLGDLSFTTDEPLEFHAIVYHPDDQKRGNDTLKKTIWVYQHPTYSKRFNKVCIGDSTLLIVDSFSKPPHRILWENQDENDSTKMLLTSDKNVSVTISRGNCSKSSTIAASMFPLPVITMPRDTILCNGQSVKLDVSTNANLVVWSPDSSFGTSKTVGDSTKTYTATAVNTTNNCIAKGEVNIRGVQLPLYTAVKDTICMNDTATIGQTHVNGFSYKWMFDTTKTTPLVNIYANNVNQTGIYKYYISYQGCRKIDSTYLKVNALPNVTAVQNRPNGICKYQFDTLVATGANSYVWETLGVGQLKIVSPLTTTYYKVTGTNLNNCSKSFTIPVIVNPQPNLVIYSNKYNDVLCQGDSAILFANGAKTYIWDDNNTDSIRNIFTSTSKQFQVIGTSDKNCKDTTQFRLEVKPNIDISAIGDTVCEGEIGTLSVVAPAGTTIDWGTLGTTKQVNVTGVKTVKYAVKVTSLEKCQKTEYAELLVKPKPSGNVNDAIICSGERAQLTATGGINYLWTQGAASATSTINVFPKVTTDYTVEVSNEFGCKDTLNTIVKVIEKSNLQFKSLAPSYNCPTIPVTLIATPVGGKFFGQGVSGNKFSVEQLETGTYPIQYIYIEPINNCKDTISLNVSVTKCVSSILEKNGLHQIEIYPNPFTQNFFIKLESQVSKIATFRMFDINGKLINEKNEKLGTGSNIIEWNQENISKGVYFIEIQLDSYTDKFKIIKE